MNELTASKWLAKHPKPGADSLFLARALSFLARSLLKWPQCTQIQLARNEAWVNLGVAYGTGMRELVVGLEGEPFWLLTEVRRLNSNMKFQRCNKK